jgi:hypothetical protein
MKNIVAIVAVLFGSAAMACPNLAGTFTCPGYDEQGNQIQVQTTLTQQDANGVTVYSMATPDTSWEMPADGKLYQSNFKDEGSGHDMTVSTSLTCNGDVLSQYLSQKEVDDQGAQVSFIDGTIAMSLNADGSMAKTAEYHLDGQTYNQADTCVRNVTPQAKN